MITNTVWITGAGGRLGSTLVKLLNSERKYKVIATGHDVDVTDMKAVMQHADLYRPTAIINCASMSDAQYCEGHMVEAFKVNALGARNLASAARKHNAKIIQLSTDDVFAGHASGSFTEFDAPNATSVYAKSKLAGEIYIRELAPKHIIIRSSWVYGTTGKNYLTYVLDQVKKNEPFEAPLDEISSPTSATELARFVVSLLDQTEYGIFHASCEGMCSRHEFAINILRLAGYDMSLVKGVFSGKPSSTLLENLMMKMTEIYEMPSWIDDLDKYMAAMKEGK